MPSLTTLQTMQLLLFLAPAFASAQQPPAFELDERGEAHFNIPVVVRLAGPPHTAAADVSSSVQRRDEESAEDEAVATNDDDESALTALHARYVLAPPLEHAVEPSFEVRHQGLIDEEEAEESDSELKEKRALVPDQALATHTILLVETTGVATSTTSDDLANSTSASHLPPPMNHTSFPLRNGTNGTLPCNGTESGGAVVKPTSSPPTMGNSASTGGKGPSGAPVKAVAGKVGAAAPVIMAAAGLGAVVVAWFC